MEALINGLKLFYTDSQKTTAPAVVFIHGFPFDHTMWDAQVAMISPSFRTITYDQRGHGKSGVGNGQYFLEFFVDDLIGLLDHLKIKRAVLCGLSMGGYVALRAMERNPERVSGLILCDTRSEADSDAAKLKRVANVKIVQDQGVPAFADVFLKAICAPTTFTDKPQVIEQIRKTMNQNTPEGIKGTLIAMATRTDTTASLATIGVPTLILVGEQDGVTPPAAASAMHERIAKSTLAVIPQAAHMSNLENPAVFNGHLQKFLSGFKV
jgi:3-oxoadipate enol-lactonase